MSDPETIFRRHHVLEQQIVKKHAGLLEQLCYAGLFDIHSERNLLNLPTETGLNAAERVKILLQQDNLIGAKHELRDYTANNTNAWLAAYSFAKLGAEMSVARGGRHVGAVAGAIAGGIIGRGMADRAWMRRERTPRMLHTMAARIATGPAVETDAGNHATGIQHD